jgi:polyphosphate kinase
MTLYETEKVPESLHQLRQPLEGRSASNYLNRELSWIDFNERVLDEAFNEATPLLERIKFLSIFASNLDEFFMIRVSGIKQQIAANVTKRSPDGMSPEEQHQAVHQRLLPLIKRKRDLLLEELMPGLMVNGVHIYDYNQLTSPQCEAMAEFFHQQVFPVLTPLAFDPGHPFPHISNLSLNLAVVVRDTEQGELFARLKVPEVLPRLVPLPEGMCNLVHPNASDGEHDTPNGFSCFCFVWIEQVIMAHLNMLFPGLEVIEAYPFRITRDADLEIEEDEADDLLRTIEQSVRQRRFGKVVRIEVDDRMPERIRHLLMSKLEIGPRDLYTVHGPLGLSDLMSLSKVDRPDLKFSPIMPGIPAVLQSDTDIFSVIRQQDVLLHHPYDSFTSVIDFIQTAAVDPNVLAIKQTLYRVGSNSPVVNALMKARESGKQVSVLVELKARFDEENNITWARALERAGVHVVYGLKGLKTHSKIALAVRQEEDRIRLYVHLGTGNYNATTARIYTDLGVLTCQPDIGADAVELFNSLTGYSRQHTYRKLLVAPVRLRERFLDLVEREIQTHREHGQGRMIFKMNAIVDPQIIDALYRASQEGVQVDLIPRGICCLRPGQPGLSDYITVRSIVGPFLEHNRIFYFYNGGNEEIYVGSADLMQRNLDRRIEVLFPIESQKLLRFIRDVLLETYLNDNVHSRVLQPDGSYVRVSRGPDEPVVDSQSISMGYHAYETIENQEKIIASKTL